MSPIALDSAPAAPALTQPLKADKATPKPTPTGLLHNTTPQPTAISAENLYITLSTGEKVLDAVSGGAAVACLGSGPAANGFNERIVRAMSAQASQLGYAYHQTIGCGAADELAQWLCERSDGALVAGAFLNSGSEAMEAVIKLARQYWVELGQPERKYIIGRFPSYHGNTLGALAVGNVPGRREIYTPLLSTSAFHHVTSPNYKRLSRAGESEAAYSARLAEELESKILELGPENVIGFFAEPVVGAALGVMPPPSGYFPAMDKIVKKYGLLMVMDEVMSGSGRVGALFAHQAVGEGVKPDILAMAKGLGGGYVPISAVLVGERVSRVVREGGQWKNSHTYQNHPVVCATALEVMKIVEEEGLLESVKERGAQLMKELKEATKGMDQVVYDVRGKGLFIGIELLGSKTLKPRLAARVKDRAFTNGLMVLGLSGTVDGVEGESIVLAPAYIVSQEQVSEIVRLVVTSIKEVVDELQLQL